jgi:hypothetical protein
MTRGIFCKMTNGLDRKRILYGQVCLETIVPDEKRVYQDE